mmetsp:Transcript_6958/g.21344  ORF Transcript_6958/g.21344 Transcript_6958/m.21344 type:complete len:220 (-) Transcript_6958:1194-1853(-)
MPCATAHRPTHTANPATSCSASASGSERSGSMSIWIAPASSAHCTGSWFSGASPSICAKTVTMFSPVRPGERNCRPVDPSSCAVRPVSSFSSRSPATSGLSPASMSPAGSSSVCLPTGGRNCFTTSSCGSRPARVMTEKTATASMVPGFVVLRWHACQVRGCWPSPRTYCRSTKRSHRVAASSVSDSTRAPEPPPQSPRLFTAAGFRTLARPWTPRVCC